MRHLSNIVFFLLIGCSCYNAQKLLWHDTLRYAACTGITSMISDNHGSVIAAGGFNGGYSGNWAASRTFFLKVGYNTAKVFLDSSTTGGGAGPIIYKSSMYFCIWLDALDGKTPKIAGTIYPEGIYLVKYNLSGSVVWAKKQSFHGIPTHMGIDRNELIYVLYNTSGGPLFTCYDQNGNSVSHSFPWGANPAFDSQNNLYVTGASQLRKFDFSGKLLWSKYAPNDAGLAVDNNGECYVSYSNGYFNSSISRIGTNGNVIWSATLPIECMVSPSVEGENLYVAGNYGSGNTIHGIEVLKLDPSNGSVIWTTKIPSTDYKLAVLAATEGHIYLSAQEWGNYSARLSMIEDLSYIPVTTSLPFTEKKSGLKVVPNPTGGVVRISHTFDDAAYATLKVMDASGRVVYLREMQDFGSGCELDLSFLERGVYIVDVQSSGGSQPGAHCMSRVVIQ